MQVENLFGRRVKGLWQGRSSGVRVRVPYRNLGYWANSGSIHHRTDFASVTHGPEENNGKSAQGCLAHKKARPP